MSFPPEILPARVNQHVSIIRPKVKSLSPFLAAALKMPAMKAKLLGVAESGATRQAITKAQIEELMVPLPPGDQVLKYKELSEHQHIARRLVVKSMEVGDYFFSSLQSGAFSGQL
jgi:type I restriction enzyme S subunit